MRVAADFGPEVNRIAVHSGASGIRSKSGVRFFIGPPAAGMRSDVHGRAVLLVGFQDQVQPLAAEEREILSVGRPGRGIVFEAIVGQAVDLSFQIDDPQVGAFVGIFVALMRVGDQGQRAAVGTPRQPLSRPR